MWKKLRSIILLPGMALVGIPGLILLITNYVNPGWWLIGLPILLVGLVVMGHSIHLFHAIGEGTLAPWDPTRRLVVAGLYRHVRNPMYLGVLLTAIGEAVLARTIWLAAWAVFLFTAFTLFIRHYEEPHLQAEYGDEYTEFMTNVPRWLPRLTPWKPPSATTASEE